MRKFVVLSVALGVFVSALFVSARVSSAEDFGVRRSPKPTPSGLLIRQEKNDDKEASREARFCELRKSLIKSYFERMLERLSALIDRLQKLIDRIQSRIDKIEASGEGINLTSPKADLASAKTNLADAKTKLDSLKADIDSFLTCTDPKASFKTVRDKVSEIKKDLNEVHRLLVHIIGNIKGLRVGETERSPKPTPTP